MLISSASAHTLLKYSIYVYEHFQSVSYLYELLWNLSRIQYINIYISNTQYAIIYSQTFSQVLSTIFAFFAHYRFP